ncbi:MAG: TIM barrel protein [Halioglobus sp.]
MRPWHSSLKVTAEVPDHRLISLATGVLPEFSPETVIHAAAEAGFNATGIWCDLDSWNRQRSNQVSRALAETGLCPLDMEVVWLQPGEPNGSHDALVEIALELGVHNVLCVSSEPDEAQTRRRFEHLCRRAEAGNLRVVLEFLAITEIKSLHEAVAVVQDVGHPAGGVLVDTLHLHRTGATAQDLRDIDAQMMPYLQLCDASDALLDDSPQGLIEDALYLRRLPGDGELPLQAILQQFDPLLPLSLEIRSRELMQRYTNDPMGRAQAVFTATQRFLQRLQQQQQQQQ